MDLLSNLETLDRWLFFLINEDLGNPFFDWLLPWWRNKLFWIPLYAGLLGLCIYWFKKKAILIIFGALAVVGLSDQVSSAMVKPSVERLRPCKNHDIKEEVNLRLKNCGAGYSFTSSHATNHFAIAIFFGLLFFKRNIWWLVGGVVWAGSISLSQVYVGVHYPSDIFAGAILGCIIGTGVFWLLRLVDKKLYSTKLKA